MLEVISFSIVVRSPRALPEWDSPKSHPYPGQFTGIFSIKHIAADQYEVSCSQLNVFTVACELAALADMYEESMTEIFNL